MLPEKYQWIGLEFEPEGDPRRLLEIARELENEGNLEGAATAYDRAYGLDPIASDVRDARAGLLERLAVVEHGLRFRYIPAGVFLMGCDTGEDDEGPSHLVWLSPYWMSETPISWAGYCRLMDWYPAPGGFPKQSNRDKGGFDGPAFHLREANKIRLQYCEDHTLRAVGWHTHAPVGLSQTPDGPRTSARNPFGEPPRQSADAPWSYDSKPMVAIAWQEAQELSARISTDQVIYSLPTEAQWEKAARGGLIGARYAWGDEPPTQKICDFDRFGGFSIRPMTTFAPNGFGLFAVNGGVWDWTRDWYDRDYYRYSPQADPQGPAEGEEKVLRGGSWADCAEAITVSFRMSRGSRS